MANRTGRTSTDRMKSAQSTREQVIMAMIISGGMTNDEVYSAFEAKDDSLIRPDDPRRIAGLVKKEYDASARSSLGMAVRSVRGLAKKAAGDQADLVQILGEGETRSASEIPYENIRRFSTGDPVMDYIHGSTSYVWILPKEWRKQINPDTGVLWDYGDIVPRKYHKYANPITGLITGNVVVNADLPKEFSFGEKTGYIETGVPESFVSVWGGAKGTGKSKLAIAVEMSTCKVHPNRAIIHNYGESSLTQLRQWIGPKAPENLIVGEKKTLAQVVSDIYRFKPLMYVVDSLQTILDTQTARGLKEVLATFKAIANEESAGKPHIVAISQLNQKGNLKGNSEIGHIADAVFKVTKNPTRKSVFLFESDKNRGGETPRGAQYQHTDDGVVCLGHGSNNRPKINLVQPLQPVIAAGVTAPNLPEDGGEDIEFEA